MARESDIHVVFTGAITKDGRARQIVTTAAFQKRLDDLNHARTPQSATGGYVVIPEFSSNWSQRRPRIRPCSSATWNTRGN